MMNINFQAVVTKPSIYQINIQNDFTTCNDRYYKD